MHMYSCSCMATFIVDSLKFRWCQSDVACWALTSMGSFREDLVTAQRTMQDDQVCNQLSFSFVHFSCRATNAVQDEQFTHEVVPFHAYAWKYGMEFDIGGKHWDRPAVCGRCCTLSTP